MDRFLPKSLLLSSLVLLTLYACSPVNGGKYLRSTVITEKDVQPIINKTNSLLYKAKIDVYNRHFSGLIVLKQTAPNTSHLTFVTEIGMKMFDFEILDSVFKLVYVFEPLNKPRLIYLLENDMKLILLQHLLNREADVFEKKDMIVYRVKQDFRYYYQSSTGNKTVEKIIKKGSLFKKAKEIYTYDDSLNAKKINLKHKGLVRLKISMEQVNKSTP